MDIAAYCYAVDFRAAREVEKRAHQILSEEDKLMHGEWFDVRPDKAMEVIEFAAMAVNVELRKDIPDEKVREAIWETVREINNKEYDAWSDDLRHSLGDGPEP